MTLCHCLLCHQGRLPSRGASWVCSERGRHLCAAADQLPVRGLKGLPVKCGHVLVLHTGTMCA